MSKATYTSISDNGLATRISAARDKIILAVPGLGDATAKRCSRVCAAVSPRR